MSASLASDYVRLFGPGEPGEIPILAPEKTWNWNTTLEFLGFVINSHTLEISAQAIKTALVDDRPRCRRRPTAQEVFRFAGKLWNLTLATIKRPAKCYYLSDASFDAISGFCRKLKIYWRYDLTLALSAELKRKAAHRKTCSVTINLLELVGMVLTAWWVMHKLVGDRPESKGDPILMRGDNFAAVTWMNRCGGARDKRAGLMMRILGRLKIQGGWRYDANIFQAFRTREWTIFYAGPDQN